MVARFVWASWLAIAIGCGGGDSGAGGVDAIAHVVKGPTSPTTSFTGRVVPAAPAAPADGQWALSAHHVQANITAISFQGAGTTPSTNMIPLTDCTVSFDATTASMSSLLDCAFAVPPGTYIGMNIALDSSYEVTISDQTNGFFTDPTAPGGLTTTEPTAGASAVTLTPSFGNGFQQVFATPLVVTASSTPAIYVEVDAVQTVYVSVRGGTPVFGQIQSSQPVVLPPIFVFPTVGAPGSAKYFAQAMTAGGVDLDPATNSAEVRVYSGSDGQPVYAFIAYTSQAVGACFTNQSTFGAYATDPSLSPAFNDGSKIGGWLARDPSGTDCWTLPANSAYSTYAAYISMPDVSTLGAATTFSCEATATPTAPASGTYASGCPAITASGSVSLGLVAD